MDECKHWNTCLVTVEIWVDANIVIQVFYFQQTEYKTSMSDNICTHIHPRIGYRNPVLLD